jgi:hypothetical protein
MLHFLQFRQQKEKPTTPSYEIQYSNGSLFIIIVSLFFTANVSESSNPYYYSYNSYYSGEIKKYYQEGDMNHNQSVCVIIIFYSNFFFFFHSLLPVRMKKKECTTHW